MMNYIILLIKYFMNFFKINNNLFRWYALFAIFLFNGCFIPELELNQENDNFIVEIDVDQNGYSINYLQVFDSNIFPFCNPTQRNEWEIDNEKGNSLNLYRTFYYNDLSPNLFLINHSAHKYFIL